MLQYLFLVRSRSLAACVLVHWSADTIIFAYAAGHLVTFRQSWFISVPGHG